MGGNEFLSINKNLLFYNCMTVWHDTFITYNLKFWWQISFLQYINISLSRWKTVCIVETTLSFSYIKISQGLNVYLDFLTSDRNVSFHWCGPFSVGCICLTSLTYRLYHTPASLSLSLSVRDTCLYTRDISQQMGRIKAAAAKCWKPVSTRDKVSQRHSKICTVNHFSIVTAHV